MSKSWGTLQASNVDRDLGVVVHMWYRPLWSWEKPTAPKGEEKMSATEAFISRIEKKPSQIMLAVTAPRGVQRDAWKGLIAAGFKVIASGLRTPGHTGGKYLFLWGKRNDVRVRLRKEKEPYFNLYSCGAQGHLLKSSAKVFPSGWGRLMVTRVPTRCKAEIPKDFKCFATTKLAKYYVSDFVKVFHEL